LEFASRFKAAFTPAAIRSQEGFGRERLGGVEAEGLLGLGGLDSSEPRPQLLERSVVSGREDHRHPQLTGERGVELSLRHGIAVRATRVKCPLENVCARTPRMLVVEAWQPMNSTASKLRVDAAQHSP